MEGRITISLSSDYMLILSELVARLNADEHLQFADQVEQRVLWDLECELESKVTAVLAPDYRAQLASAWQRVRDPPSESPCTDEITKLRSDRMGTVSQSLGWSTGGRAGHGSDEG